MSTSVVGAGSTLLPTWVTFGRLASLVVEGAGAACFLGSLDSVIMVVFVVIGKLVRRFVPVGWFLNSDRRSERVASDRAE